MGSRDPACPSHALVCFRTGSAFQTYPLESVIVYGWIWMRYPIPPPPLLEPSNKSRGISPCRLQMDLPKYRERNRRRIYFIPSHHLDHTSRDDQSMVWRRSVTSISGYLAMDVACRAPIIALRREGKLRSLAADHRSCVRYLRTLTSLAASYVRDALSDYRRHSPIATLCPYSCKLIVSMAKEKYYVVLVGRWPGIYLTWDDARVEVEGYSGSRHRVFKNWRDATAYWDSFFGLATAPPTHGCGARSGEVGRLVEAVDVHHSAMLSIHRTYRATMLRPTSTDDLLPLAADRLLALLIGVMVIFFALYIMIKL